MRPYYSYTIIYVHTYIYICLILPMVSIIIISSTSRPQLGDVA